MVHAIKFIHAADLHLDSPFKGLADMPGNLFEQIQNSTFAALNQLVDAAIEEKVDFILITGDLFDNERQSLKAQIRLRTAFERLEAHDIPIYLSYGNHDYINGNVHQVAYPANVHIFPDESVCSFTFAKNGEPIAAIYGFSYEDRAVTENKAKEFEVVNPEIPFHIAMLHGSIQGNKEHEPYAPFHLSDLIEKDFRYWALGHIHKRTILKENPFIVYPGNIQGRHRKETGEKGCYIVHMTNEETELTFLPLQAIAFTSVEVDVSACENIFQVEKQLVAAITQLSAKDPQLLDITFHSKNTLLRNWQMEGQLDEIIEIVNENLVNEHRWQYIFHHSVEVEERSEIAETGYGEHFLGELQRSFEESKGVEYLGELFQHQQARKYLDLPDEVELEWKHEARERLMERLVKGGGK